MIWLLFLVFALRQPELSVTKTLVQKYSPSSDSAFPNKIYIQSQGAESHLLPPAESDGFNRSAVFNDGEETSVNDFEKFLRSDKRGRRTTIAEKVDEDWTDGKCNIGRCLMICEVIYKEVGQYYAQCMDKNCFCFKKEELFPAAVKGFLKTATLFGMPQQYD